MVIGSLLFLCSDMYRGLTICSGCGGVKDIFKYLCRLNVRFFDNVQVFMCCFGVAVTEAVLHLLWELCELLHILLYVA